MVQMIAIKTDTELSLTSARYIVAHFVEAVSSRSSSLLWSHDIIAPITRQT